MKKDGILGYSQSYTHYPQKKRLRKVKITSISPLKRLNWLGIHENYEMKLIHLIIIHN